NAADAFVFSRHAYVPCELDGGRAEIIPPSIDPLSPKNQELAPETVRSVLRHVGLVGGRDPDADDVPAFRRFDGSWARVERRCDLRNTGSPPSADTPLVVQ